MEIIYSAFIWAFFFIAFTQMLLYVSFIIFRMSINKMVELELKRFEKLEKLSKEIDECHDAVKLKIYEKYLERCKKRYLKLRESKARTEN